MKAALVLLLAVVGAMGAPDTRFRCEECVDELHKRKSVNADMVRPHMGKVATKDSMSIMNCLTLGAVLSSKDLALLFLELQLWMGSLVARSSLVSLKEGGWLRLGSHSRSEMLSALSNLDLLMTRFLVSSFSSSASL